MMHDRKDDYTRGHSDNLDRLEARRDAQRAEAGGILGGEAINRATLGNAVADSAAGYVQFGDSVSRVVEATLRRAGPLSTQELGELVALRLAQHVRANGLPVELDHALACRGEVAIRGLVFHNPAPGEYAIDVRPAGKGKSFSARLGSVDPLRGKQRWHAPQIRAAVVANELRTLAREEEYAGDGADALSYSAKAEGLVARADTDQGADWGPSLAAPLSDVLWKEAHQRLDEAADAVQRAEALTSGQRLPR